jgi:ATP-dependent RNA/DNA helicase IGHMBP2
MVFFNIMEIKHPYIDTLLACLDLEELEQTKRFQLDEQHNLKSLKAEGLAIHPIRINRKTFGYADYPELNFRIPFPADTGNFRDGMAIECFCQGEEPVKGMLLNLEGKQGEIRLFAPDFPDWIEEEGVGIKLTPDTRTTTLMTKALNELYLHSNQQSLFNKIHSDKTIKNQIQETEKGSIEHFFNKKLNESQQIAVNRIQHFEELLIIHGPPGTGKTTTLIEAILQLVKKGEKILVSAPSNTAVDNIASGLIDKNINFIRVGNNTKVNAQIFPFTPEGKLKDSKQEKEIKKLKIRAVEFRKMANQYKRRFGKEERDQRNLLIKEVKSIRKEIKDIQNYNEEQLFENARVILGTPIGLMDGQVQKLDYQTLIIDEAGQCLEPLAWCIIPLAEKVILAGDHLQLPPTILSDKAAQLGLRHSILEVCFSKIDQIYLLDTQYRMRESIAQFSNEYFYDGKLKTPIHLLNTGEHITFYDTAGAGFDEERGPDGTSLMNKGEIDIILKIIEKDNLQLNNTAVISPYSGQVTLAKDLLKSTLRISTIDSFQGQEEENVIISLVRSNNEGQIGFLKDYRRMNVAMTRAKEKLIIIGDSSTLAKDQYYAAFIDYIEKINAYKSVWEII